MAHKWTIEAMLCCDSSPEEIALIVPIQPEVLHYYRYYLFDLSNKDTVAKIQYIEASCQPTTYDGISKLIATKYGFKLYRITSGDTSLIKTEADVDDVLRMVTQENTEVITKAAFDPNSGINGALRIHLVGLKSLLVKTKVATEEQNRLGGKTSGGTGSNLTESIDDMLRDDIVADITAIEDKEALAIGGLAAKNVLEDQQKTHIQASLESINAPEDKITEAELDDLGFNHT
jgi:hypothetical protein